MNYYRKNEGYKFEEEITDDPIVIDNSSALAPHGVPTNPIAHSVSRQNVDQNVILDQNKMGNLNDANNNINQNTSAYEWDPNAAWN